MNTGENGESTEFFHRVVSIRQMVTMEFPKFSENCLVQTISSTNSYNRFLSRDIK